MTADLNTDLLSKVSIASPCKMDWDSMTGDERTRFCVSCSKNVYNISDMTTMEAAAFLREIDGRACVRLFRRHDGTILTDDCPLHFRKLRDKARKITKCISAAIAFVLSTCASQAQSSSAQSDRGLLNSKHQITTPLPPHGSGTVELGGMLGLNGVEVEEVDDESNTLIKQPDVAKVLSNAAQTEKTKKLKMSKKMSRIKEIVSEKTETSPKVDVVCRLLLCDPIDLRRRRAILTIYRNGCATIRPSLYVDRTTGKINDPLSLSLGELNTLWGPSSSLQDFHRFEFRGNYYADLKFENDVCSHIRITGPSVTNSGWLTRKQVIDILGPDYKLHLPEEIGIVEPPAPQSHGWYYD